MILSVIIPKSLVITIATLRMALEQPILPGKLILWTLLMLSLVSWSVIVSKVLSFRRFRKSDILFTKRLRRSKATLEVFEEGWQDSSSLHHDIYLIGAKEAAFQLLGSREADPAIHNRIKKAGKLSKRQTESMRRAFLRGLESASDRLDIGLSVLRITAITAPLIGLVGMIWMLMRGFDVAKTFEEIAPWVSGSLTYLVFALIVCIPALLSVMVFRGIGRDRKRELNDYTAEIIRLFERSFAAPEAATMAQDLIGDDVSIPSDLDVNGEHPELIKSGRKEYRSIREAFERESDNQSPQSLEKKNFQRVAIETPINPIARQASSMQHYAPTFE